MSYERLGDVAVAQGTLDEAARAYGDGLAIRTKLDPGTTQWQRDLSVSYIMLGDVAVVQGKLDEAARAYGDCLAIARKLAAGDPGNTVWQRDLSVSYSKLADFIDRQLAPIEEELDQALKNIKAYRKTDPGYKKAIKAFIEAEVAHAAQDPMEGARERPAVGPAVSMVREMLRG